MLWPSIPQEAALELFRLSPDEVEIASVRCRTQQAIACCQPIFDRHNRPGVE